MMTGNTNTAALNVQKCTNLVPRGEDLYFSPNGFGDMFYLGCFQSQNESSLERLPVS